MFDNINFAEAEIPANCNFQGMRITGVPIEELFAAYREVKAGTKAKSKSEPPTRGGRTAAKAKRTKERHGAR